MPVRDIHLRLAATAIGVAASVGLAVAPAEALSLLAWQSVACATVSSSGRLDGPCVDLGPLTVFDSTANTTAAEASLSVGNMSANAFQSPGGYDRARADAAATLDAAAGAQAIFSMTVRNDAAAPVPLMFKFLISNAALAIALDNYVAAGDSVPQAAIASRVKTTRNGVSTIHWLYTAILAASNDEVLPGLQDSLNAIDPQGIGKLSVDTLDRSLGAASVDFAPFVGVLDLGTLDPGEAIILEYTINAIAYTGEHDPLPRPSLDPPSVSLSALIEDPFSLDAGFFLNGRSLASLIGANEAPGSTVPAPAGWLLLGVGIAAAVIARRRPR